MLKFTVKVGDYEHIYEGETSQDIVNLKNALNPSVLVATGDVESASSDLNLAKIALAKIALEMIRDQYGAGKKILTLTEMSNIARNALSQLSSKGGEQNI